MVRHWPKIKKKRKAFSYQTKKNIYYYIDFVSSTQETFFTSDGIAENFTNKLTFTYKWPFTFDLMGLTGNYWGIKKSNAFHHAHIDK